MVNYQCTVTARTRTIARSYSHTKVGDIHVTSCIDLQLFLTIGSVSPPARLQITSRAWGGTLAPVTAALF